MENNSDFERERIELEKQKLEFEKQKFEFEKEKHSAGNVAVLQPAKNEKINITAIALGLISIGTLFLEWLKPQAHESVSILGQNLSGHQSIVLNGININEGMAVFAFLIAGLIFNIKGKNIAAGFGLIALLIIGEFIFRMNSSKADFNADGVSSSFKLEILMGCYASTGSIFLYTILSYFNLSILFGGDNSDRKFSKQTLWNLLCCTLYIASCVFFYYNELVYFSIALLCLIPVLFMQDYKISKHISIVLCILITLNVVLNVFINTNSEFLSEVIDRWNYGFPNYFNFVFIILFLALLTDMIIKYMTKPPAIPGRKIKIISYCLVLPVIVWLGFSYFIVLSKSHNATSSEKLLAKQNMQALFHIKTPTDSLNGVWYFSFPEKKNQLPLKASFWCLYMAKDSPFESTGSDDPNEIHSNVHGDIPIEINLTIGENELFSNKMNGFKEVVYLKYPEYKYKLPLDLTSSDYENYFTITSISNDTIKAILKFKSDVGEAISYDIIGVDARNLKKEKPPVSELGLTATVIDSVIVDNIIIPKIVTENASVNEKISSLINKTVDISSKEMHYAVNYNLNNILSICLCAVPIETIQKETCRNFNFNLKTGDEIKLANIIKEGMTDALAVKADSILHVQIDELLLSNKSFLDAIDPYLEKAKMSKTDLEDFKLTSNGIEFKYDYNFPEELRKYEPDGIVKISYSDLKEFINPRSQLGFLFSN